MKKPPFILSSLIFTFVSGALLMLLWNIFFMMIGSGSWWGLNWRIAQGVGILMAIVGLTMSLGLRKLKKWAWHLCIWVSLLNLIWIVVERALFFNRYVVPLTINIGDLRRCYFTRLVMEKMDDGWKFVNRISPNMDMLYHFKIGFLEQLIVAVFYLFVLFVMTRKEVRESFQ